MGAYAKNLAAAEKIKAKAYEDYDQAVRDREALFEVRATSRLEMNRVALESNRIMAEANKKYDEQMAKYRRELVFVNMAWTAVKDWEERS